MKERTGYVYQDRKSGAWFARVCYTQNNGKRTSVKRRVESKSQGNKVLKELVAKVESGGREALEADKLTVNDLCRYYEEHYAIPAQYSNGRKVAGLRSVVQVKGYLKVYREHFGRCLLKSITYDDLRTFRTKRLNTKTHQSEQRSLTTVNREMAYLRRLLNIAERNSWIARNPFKLGDALIHASDERRRERILTLKESQDLIDACEGRRAHLRPIVIAGLDTGCRMREILKLRWLDIDLREGIITIQAFNTKTMRERQVSITTRLNHELEKLWAESGKEPDSFVFSGINDVRHAFRRACEEAGLEEIGKERITFHHLRHFHAVRLDDLGFSLTKIGAQLGHVVLQTSLRYTSHRDKEAVKAVSAALDISHAQQQKQSTNTEVSELVN
jgi:integrase